MAELTICFESNFEVALQRKSVKYMNLVEEVQAKGYKTTLITFQVGSRGVPDFPGFETLARTLKMPPKVFKKLLECVKASSCGII